MTNVFGDSTALLGGESHEGKQTGESIELCAKIWLVLGERERLRSLVQRL